MVWILKLDSGFSNEASWPVYDCNVYAFNLWPVHSCGLDCHVPIDDVFDVLLGE